MNYLAHAFLSFNDPQRLTGNMIGDHVKGKKALETFPEGIREGLILHRKIDAFTDVHPAVARAKVWFRKEYHLYAGAIVDIVMDHYLANDPRYFETEKELLSFSLATYEKLASQAEYFPGTFANYFPHMQQHNWLYNYRKLPHMINPLKSLERRAPQIPAVQKAYEIFVGHYYLLNQCYYELIDDVVSFVKAEISTK